MKQCSASYYFIMQKAKFNIMYAYCLTNVWFTRGLGLHPHSWGQHPSGCKISRVAASQPLGGGEFFEGSDGPTPTAFIKNPSAHHMEIWHRFPAKDVCFRQHPMRPIQQMMEWNNDNLKFEKKIWKESFYIDQISQRLKKKPVTLNKHTPKMHVCAHNADNNNGCKLHN